MITGNWQHIDTIPESQDVLITTGDRLIVGFKHAGDKRIYESYHSPSLLISNAVKWHELPKANEV